MTTLTTTDAIDGTTATAAFINNNFAAVEAVVNGNIDNANINAAAAIAVSKLAPGTNGYILRTVNGVTSWSAEPFTFAKNIGVVQVINTTAESTLYSQTITAGYMGIDRALQFTAVGDLVDNDSATVTFRVKFGGSNVFVVGPISLSDSASARSWQINVEIQNLSGASTQWCTGTMIVGSGTAFTADVWSHQDNTAAINTANDQTLEITAQYSAATSASQCTRRYTRVLLV